MLKQLSSVSHFDNNMFMRKNSKITNAFRCTKQNSKCYTVLFLQIQAGGDSGSIDLLMRVICIGVGTGLVGPVFFSGDKDIHSILFLF